jgi:preprotein translocase subunit YajC
MNLSSLLLPLIIVLFAVPLFLGTRKQKRAVAQQQELQNSLSYGDRVMTTSGLYGTVVAVSDESIDIEIAPGITTSWLRAAVREKVADSTVGLVDDADDDYDDSDLVEETEAHDEVEPVNGVATHGTTNGATNGVEINDTVPTTPESHAEIAPSLEESSKKAR